MDALTAIESRRCRRNFDSRPVPREILEKIVNAGRLAPTARNVQPWEFVVVTDASTRERLAALCENGPFIAQAPACVAVFCKDTKYFLEDGCNATTNILVAVTALGLQACWVAGEKKDYAAAVGQMLKAPAGFRLISLIPVGYGTSADEPLVKKRALNEVIHWEKF